MRQIRNPEKWIGRRVPAGYNRDGIEGYGVCDDCGCLYPERELWPLLYPESEADIELLEYLEIDETMDFCPGCTVRLEVEAEVWRMARERPAQLVA